MFESYEEVETSVDRDEDTPDDQYDLQRVPLEYYEQDTDDDIDDTDNQGQKPLLLSLVDRIHSITWLGVIFLRIKSWRLDHSGNITIGIKNSVANIEIR